MQILLTPMERQAMQYLFENPISKTNRFISMFSGKLLDALFDLGLIAFDGDGIAVAIDCRSIMGFLAKNGKDLDDATWGNPDDNLDLEAFEKPKTGKRIALDLD
jgi:hypothetical protein